MSFLFRAFADTVRELGRALDDNDAIATAAHLLSSIADDNDLAVVTRWLSSHRLVAPEHTISSSAPVAVFAALSGTPVDEPDSLDHELFAASQTMAGSPIETVRMLLVARDRAGMPPLVSSVGLLVEQVAEFIELLARMRTAGERTQLLVQLWRAMNPDEIAALHRILSRAATSVMLSDDSLARAIADAFSQPMELVRHALLTRHDPGSIAITARSGELNVSVVQPMRIIPAMHAQLIERTIDQNGNICLHCDALTSSDYVVEERLPGVRVQLHAWASREDDDPAIALFTASGRDLSSALPQIVRAASCIPSGTVIDAHVIVVDKDGGVLDVHMLERSASRAAPVDNEDSLLVAFDLLVVDSVSQLDHPLEKRRRRLEDIAAQARLHLTRVIDVRDHDHLVDIYSRMLERGATGLIAKKRHGAYAFGRRSSGWVKAPGRSDTLLAVVRYVDAMQDDDGDRAERMTFGVWREDASEPRLVNIGRAGYGLDEADLIRLEERLTTLRGKRFGRNYEVEPEIVCELEYDAIRLSPRTGAGFRIRIARIRRVRWDLEIDAAATVADVAVRHRALSRMRDLADAIYIPL